MSELESIQNAWQSELQRRLPECEFTTADAGALLRNFSIRLFNQHFREPRYTSIEPPLPGLPSLPLDHRWVELRLQEGLYFSGQELDPIRSILERADSFGARKTNRSLQNMLANTESYLIFGTPGAGKSTLVKWAARFLMTELRGPSILPMMIPLRSFARWKQQHRDGDVYEFFWTSQLRLPAKHSDVFRDFMIDVESLPELSGICRVLLDGWDEIPRDLLGDIEHEVERFRHLLPTLATSRPTHVGLSYLPDRRFDIVPLPFESMRALMKEWFERVERPELEEELCQHLDSQIEMRELAQNPYVLTLLCAVFAGVDGQPELPNSRTELYRHALQLMVRYCRNKFASSGYEFSQDDIRKSEQTAYVLLGRSDASPFEFSKSEISEIAGDDGHLAQTWDHARLIVLAKEFEAVHSFLHPTIHEYLAGQELARRLNSGDADPVQAGTDPLWMRACVFAVNSVGSDSPLWKSLATVLENRDEFGLLLLRVASLLTEVRASSGSISLIGHDIRPMLWDLFCTAPDPTSYAKALVQLCPLYAIQRAEEEGAPTTATLPRIMMLHSRMSPSIPQRTKLVALSAQVRFTGECVVSSGVENLASFMGHQPDEAPNLAAAMEIRSSAEIVEELAGPPSPRRRTARIRCAHERTEQAENLLLEQFATASDEADISELLDALEILGTLRVRDSIMSRLQSMMDQPDILTQALRVLRQFSIDEGVENVLHLLETHSIEEVRIEAALAVGGAISDEALRRLGEFAKTTEENFEVRKAAIQGLARSRTVWLVKDLWTEEFSERPEPSERLVVSGYLAAIAQTTPTGEAPSMVQTWIPPYFIRRLRSEDLHPIEVVHSAACSDVELIRKEWHRLLENHQSEEIRAAVCEAVRRKGDQPSVEAVLKTLNTLKKKSESNKLRYQATLAIAFLRPDKIPDLRKLCSEEALWRFSLETDTLVFPDRLVKAVDYRKSPAAAPDDVTIVSFLKVPRDDVTEEWGPEVRRILEERKDRYAILLEDIEVSLDDLTVKQLHRELKVLHYVFIEHLDEYQAFRKCLQESRKPSNQLKEVFREANIEAAIGHARSSFKATAAWNYVQESLSLKRKRKPRSKSSPGRGKDKASEIETQQGADGKVVTVEELQERIRNSPIDAAEKASLLQQLKDDPTDTARISEILRIAEENH